MSRGLWNTAAQFVERGYAAKAPWYFNTPLLSSRGGTTASLPGEQSCDADAARTNKSVRVCSHMVHHKIPRTKLRDIFFIACFWGNFRLCTIGDENGLLWRRPPPAAETESQSRRRASPAQGVQADAVTASRRPAVRHAGQKQSSGRFLERGGFYASPRICLISAKSAAK